MHGGLVRENTGSFLLSLLVQGPFEITSIFLDTKLGLLGRFFFPELANADSNN